MGMLIRTFLHLHRSLVYALDQQFVNVVELTVFHSNPILQATCSIFQCDSF